MLLPHTSHPTHNTSSSKLSYLLVVELCVRWFSRRTGLRAHSMGRGGMVLARGCSWENENVHTSVDPTATGQYRCNCWCDQRDHIGAQLKTETYIYTSHASRHCLHPSSDSLNKVAATHSAIMIVRIILSIPLLLFSAVPLASARSPPHADQQILDSALDWSPPHAGRLLQQQQQRLSFSLDWVRRSYERPRVGQECGDGGRGTAAASAAAGVRDGDGGGRREVAAAAAAAGGGKGPCVGLIGILSHP